MSLVHTRLHCYLIDVKCLSPVAHDSINHWGKPMGRLQDDEEIIIIDMTLLLKSVSCIVLQSITVPLS